MDTPETIGHPETHREIVLKAFLKAASTFLVVLIVATSLGTTSYLIYRSQVNSPIIRDIHKNGEQTKQILDTIKGCTTPGQKCYDDGQKRTAGFINGINQVVVLAAYCARIPENDTIDLVEKCVRNNLHP